MVITSSTTEAKTVSYVQKLAAFRMLTNMLLTGAGGGGGAQPKFRIYLLDDPEQMKVVRSNLSDTWAAWISTAARPASRTRLS